MSACHADDSDSNSDLGVINPFFDFLVNTMTNRIGAGSLSTNPEVFKNRIYLFDDNVIGHTQLMIIPESDESLEQIIDLNPDMPVIIHAPHHCQYVNPCDKELFSPPGSADRDSFIEEAMNLTFHAADALDSDTIIFHAGRYRNGKKDEAIGLFHEFLDCYYEPRLTLELISHLRVEDPYLGVTPDELKILGSNKVKGFCIDFPHLFCTSCMIKKPYGDLLAEMKQFPIKYSHISGTPGPDTDDQHLLLDDPDNILPMAPIRTFLTDYPEMEIGLEIGTDDPSEVAMQVRLLSELLSKA